MKLFVVNETSPYPEDWSIWSEFSLVIAESREQVIKLEDLSPDTKITEVDMTKPHHVCSMSEPAWGDDL